jgi:hypothetical protein
MKSLASFLATVFLVAAAGLAVLAPRAAHAQEPAPPAPPTFDGRIVAGSVPSDGGFGVVVFSGGTFDQLVEASGCPVSRVVFWVTQGGQFLVYIPGSAVAAPSADFMAAFPGNFIPPLTPLIGRCVPGTPASGIQGVVTRGPLCPVQTDIQPCPDEPYRATIVFRDVDGNEVARIASASSDGRYRVALAPGAYTVVPVNPEGPFPHASPQSATVEAGRFTVVNIVYDTGIRSAQGQ